MSALKRSEKISFSFFVPGILMGCKILWELVSFKYWGIKLIISTWLLKKSKKFLCQSQRMHLSQISFGWVSEIEFNTLIFQQCRTALYLFKTWKESNFLKFISRYCSYVTFPSRVAASPLQGSIKLDLELCREPNGRDCFGPGLPTDHVLG